MDCDLACLALVQNHPDPHLVIRDPAYRWLPVGTLGEDRIGRTLKIGGKELAREERSMLGHVAATRNAKISGDVLAETFYVPAKDNMRSEVAVPVVLSGEVLGVLDCENKKRNSYNESHLDLLRLVARLIAPTLEELLTQGGMRNRFAEVFRQVGALLDSVAPGIPLEESEVLGRIAAVIARFVQCRGCAIWLFGFGRSKLTVRGAVGKYQVGQSVDRHGDAARWLAIDGMRPVILSQADPSCLIVPLLSRGEPIGVIEVAEKGGSIPSGRRSFTAADQALLQALQGQIATSIELRRVDAERREQIQAQSRRVSSLVGIFQKDDLAAALLETVKQVPKLCDGRYCSVFLWDEGRRSFVLRASKGLDRKWIGVADYRRKEGLTGWVGHYGRSLNLDNRQGGLTIVGADLKWKSKYQEGPTARPVATLPWMGVPILVAGQSVGVIRVSERIHPGFFSQADEQVLNLVAGHLGASIADLQDRQRRTELRTRLRDSRNIVTRVIGESGLGVSGRVDESLRKAVRLAAGGLRSDQACLLKLNADGTSGEVLWYPHEAVTPAPAPDPAIITAIREEGFKCWNYSRKRPASDQSAWARFLADAKIVSSAGVLLKVGERPVAVLLLNFRSPQGFDHEDQDIIESYALYLALCLEIARLAREFHESGAREIAESIAQDIHDAVLPMLSAHVVRRLGGAKDMIRAQKYSDALHELTSAERAVRFAANECRSVMNILGSHIVHDLGLVAALRDLTNILVLGTSELILDLPPADGPLPPPVKMHLYRIAEAALGNAIHHARASRIVLRLEVARQDVLLAVQDNGIGFLYDEAVSNEGHYGLKGIRDRVRGLGGRLQVNSAPGAGTSIEVRVPIWGEHADHTVFNKGADVDQTVLAPGQQAQERQDP